MIKSKIRKLIDIFRVNRYPNLLTSKYIYPDPIVVNKCSNFTMTIMKIIHEEINVFNVDIICNRRCCGVFDRIFLLDCDYNYDRDILTMSKLINDDDPFRKELDKKIIKILDELILMNI